MHELYQQVSFRERTAVAFHNGRMCEDWDSIVHILSYLAIQYLLNSCLYSSSLIIYDYLEFNDTALGHERARWKSKGCHNWTHKGNQRSKASRRD